MKRRIDTRKGWRLGNALELSVGPAFFGAPGTAPAVAWNPSDKDADVTLSGSNLVATVNNTSGSILGAVRATLAKAAASANHYFVVEMAGASLDSGAGIGTAAAGLGDIPGGGANGYGYVPAVDTRYNAGSGAGYLIPSFAEKVGVMYDADAGKITLKRAGRFYAESYTIAPGTMLYPMWGPGTSGAGTFTGTYDGNATDIGLDEGYSAWGGTWNSADKSANVALSGADLIATVTSGGGSVRGTVGRNSGKWGFQITRGSSDNVLAGVGTSGASLSTYPGANTSSWGYYWQGNQRYTNNSGSAMPSAKSIVKVGVWLNAGTLRYICDGTLGGNAATGLSGDFFPMWGSGTGSTGSRSGTAQFTGSIPWQPPGSSAWQ